MLRFSGVLLDIYNWNTHSMLTQTSYPHQYTGESQERRHVAICFVKTFRFKIVKNLTRNALNIILLMKLLN
ncbi:hypothetical protein YC2023_016113 [Brassica napus]